MHDDYQFLIDGYLDDTLAAHELRRLNDFVKSDAECARQFARAALLHDRLRTEVALSEASPPPIRSAERPQASSVSRRNRLAAALITTAAAVVIGFVMRHGGATPASAASLALDRIIEAASQQVDRVYRIRITDYGPNGPQPQVAADRGGVKPNVDGAELSVRGRDQFVLVRRFADGSPFVTGSDGEIGWAVPPTGHVHLSRDIRRFRRAVPGEREAIPFLDLEASLEELRRDYELELVEGDAQAAGAEGWSRLDARKHKRVRGGPEQVQIWFDGAGTAHRIALLGLPHGEPDGSPQAVQLDLLTNRDVPTNFFHHDMHHAPDRPQAWE
ncbi:MAG: hypothetical protein JNL96_20555 [Planctomycetaceae bacterium]|nr:hypothetical protein [Planctomycetaceae bacterium]